MFLVVWWQNKFLCQCCLAVIQGKLLCWNFPFMGSKCTHFLHKSYTREFTHQNGPLFLSPNVPILVNKVSSKARYILFLMALFVGIHTMCLLVTKVSRSKSYNACVCLLPKLHKWEAMLMLVTKVPLFVTKCPHACQQSVSHKQCDTEFWLVA